MTVLVTGGAGYIGSHAVLRLLRDGQRVVAVDNLFRGHVEAIERLQTVAQGRLTFVPADVGDGPLMARLLAEHNVKSVMHFAAMAYVGESVTQPLRYYRNNTAATLSLLEAIQQSWTDPNAGGGVEKLVFSSTCASYGEPPRQFIPIPETCPQQPVNPYGWSKLFCEIMMRDFAAQAWRDKRPFSWAALRYFNVAGSDSSGLIGEHHEPETHLIPVCLQVVLGQREALSIHGTDYPTPDGTCIRDYVHVEDLVSAHILVAERLVTGSEFVFNVGTGQGVSVREVLDACRRVTGHPIPATVGPRRAGDPPRLVGSPASIARDLGWKAKHTSIERMVEDAWRWRQAHPHGW